MTFPNLRISGSFKWTVLSAFLAVVIGDYLFFQQEWFAGGLGVFGLVLIGLLLARRSVVRRNGPALIAAFAATVFAIAMMYDANLLAWTMFWIAAGMATLLPSVERFDDGWLWSQRLLRHGCRAIFAPIIDFVRARRVRHRVPQRRINMRAAMALFALPVGGSLIILVLLMAANPILDSLVLSGIDIDVSGVSFGRITLWLLLFIFAWSLLRPRAMRPMVGTFDGSGDLAIPGVSIASITLSLIAFNLLFALQNLMDIAYLGGLVALPDDMTLAGYAHRGAYPLIATAMLAGLFVLVVLRPRSQAASVPVIRAMVSLWIAQNILLVTFSILRTMDYIASYALTPLRIAALAWMMLVAIGLCLILWRMWRGKSASWLINSNLSAAAIMLTMACFVDLGAVSAGWNIRHAKEVGGTGVNLDLCYLNHQGGSSLLSLIALEQEPDIGPKFRQRVQSVRMQVMANLEWKLERGNWTWLAEQRLKTAREELASFKSKPLPVRALRCDGSLALPHEPAARVFTAESETILVVPPSEDIPDIRSHPLTGESLP